MKEAPQLTVRAVLLSMALTVVLAAANAYLGLFAGLTVATAIPAAVATSFLRNKSEDIVMTVTESV